MESVLVQSYVRFNKPIPFHRSARNTSFQSLLLAGRKSGLDLYLSRIDLYEAAKQHVRLGWQFENGWKKVRSKQVDLVYYHGSNMAAKRIGNRVKALGLPIINESEFEILCDDKLLTSMVFPDIMPKTFLINNHNQLQQALYHITSKKIVLKPRFGSYGKGVVILDKKDLKNGIRRNTILQEFIESRNGIDSLHVKGRHDIRLIIIDGRIDHCYVREPKPGSYLGNMEQGAKKNYFTNSKIPSHLRRTFRIVEQRVRKFNTRIYSADFLIDYHGRPWLIELNSKPGTLYYQGAEKVRDRYYLNLCKSLKNYVSMAKYK